MTTIIEGTRPGETRLVEIDGILGGLRSGLTYGGARSIKELQRKAEFVEVGPGYGFESAPRPN